MFQGYITPSQAASLSITSSGGVQSGSLGPGVVFSGNIASGQVAWAHLSSGAVRSGHIANAAVTSGNIASGSIGSEHIASATILTVNIASGAVQSGEVGSGAILGHNASGAFNIASGTIGRFNFGSGVVLSGHLADTSVVSGSIGSGQIGQMHLSSGSVNSGHHGNNSVTSGNVASGSLSVAHFISGFVFPGAGITIAPSLSGYTITNASGSVTGLSSGSVTSGFLSTSSTAAAVLSGNIASGAVLGQVGGGSFNVASGSLGTYDFSSGSIVRASQFVASVHSGTSWNLLTGEPISGGRAVSISTAGTLQIAMAANSGRMPAIGVVVDNVASGIQANVYQHGFFTPLVLGSGVVDYSGYVTKTVWVGRSGQLVTTSGSFNSGGFTVTAGGDWLQRLGTVVTSGSFVLNVNPDVIAVKLVSVNDTIDVFGLGYGI